MSCSLFSCSIYSYGRKSFSGGAAANGAPARTVFGGEIGQFISKSFHIFFPPMVTFALGKTVRAGNYTCERRCAIKCVQMAPQDHSACKYLTKRTEMLIASCLPLSVCLMDELFFPKHVSAFPSSPFFPFFKKKNFALALESSLMCVSTSPTRPRLIPGQHTHPRRRARA